MKIKNLSRIGAVMVCSVLTFSALNPTVYAANDFDPTSTDDNSIANIKNDGSSELPATGGIQDVLLVALGAGVYTTALCYLVIHFSNKRRK